MRVVSRLSSKVIGGRIVGILFASIVFACPGRAYKKHVVDGSQPEGCAFVFKGNLRY
jgi:hypothetical protein